MGDGTLEMHQRLGLDMVVCTGLGYVWVMGMCKSRDIQGRGSWVEGLSSEVLVEGIVVFDVCHFSASSDSGALGAARPGARHFLLTAPGLSLPCTRLSRLYFTLVG